MRMAALIAIIALAGSAIAAPSFLSQGDIGKISAAVHAVTSEPIISIDSMYVSKPVAGSIPRDMFTTDIIAPGKTQMRRIITYERTDRVSVRTGSLTSFKGRGYEVRKAGDRWRIVGKSVWMR